LFSEKTHGAKPPGTIVFSTAAASIRNARRGERKNYMEHGTAGGNVETDAAAVSDENPQRDG